MLIRCAFFRGHVKPGMEEEFFRHVHDKLVPLWSQFPGVQEVRAFPYSHLTLPPNRRVVNWVGSGSLDKKKN